MNDPKIPLTALPKTTNEKIAWLRLARSRRVGPATFVRLLNEYGSAANALNALPEIAEKSGAKNYSPCALSSAKSEFERGLYAGYKPLFLSDPTYPKLLAEAPDAPAFLWAAGKREIADAPSIGLVGARNASSLGRRVATTIAQDLGEMGYTVISGLARGIDTAAHKAALPAKTIAVVAGGIDIPYPKENADLMDRIKSEGLVLSEQPLGLHPQARHFPQRNRIIAGLVEALCVIEGAARSGSLITARAASDLGREVMAVPGNPFDPRAAGCNALIRDGAVLIRNARDIQEALAKPNATSHEVATFTPSMKPKGADEDHIQTRILDMLSGSAVAEDIVIRDSGYAAEHVARHLAKLELAGQVLRQPGGLLARAG